MGELIPLQADDLPVLDDRLNGVRHEPSSELAAGYGDWAVSLTTAESGKVQAASMTRCGVEKYAFERTGDGAWAAKDAKTRFPEAHFYNLVHIATMEGLEWAESPASGTLLS